MVDAIEQVNDLLSKLQSPDYYAREEAVQRLGKCDKDEAIAGLVMALEDTDLGIRELAANFLSQMESELAYQLLIRFLGHDDIGTRNLAAEILVKIGERSVPALISQIDSDDHDVRKFIVDILGLIGDQRSLEAVCGRLDDTNINVACSAAEALGEIRAVEAVQTLVAAARDHEDVRPQAIEALGKIGDAGAIKYLIDCLTAEDPMILFAAIEALGAIGHVSALEELKSFLKHHDKTLAETALCAIIDIANATGRDLRLGLSVEDYREFLSDGIRNGNRRVTDFTLSRLEELKDNQLTGQLIEALPYVDEDVKGRILEALTAAGDTVTAEVIPRLDKLTAETRQDLLNVIKYHIRAESAPELARYAEDPDPEIRRTIAYMLGVSGNPAVTGALRTLAHDPVGHVRAAAYGALGWLCTDTDIDFLFSGLDDKYQDVREAAMGALVIIGGPSVVRRFSEDLYHEDAERQRLSATALGMIGDAHSVEPLLRAINHPEAAIRKSAIDSLAKIRDVSDTEPLALALNDENSCVRKAAVSAIAAIRGSDAVSEIRFLLEDEDLWVRYHTISVIGELESAEHYELIVKHLDSDQDIIKIAAMKALARMGCRKALPEIRKYREVKNPDLAEAARLAASELQERTS